MPRPASKAVLQLMRSLKTGKGRDEHDAFLAEGVRLIEEAMRQGLTPANVVFDADAFDARPELQALAAKAKDRALSAGAKDFASISDTVASQGVVAAFARLRTSPRDALGGQGPSTLLVLDNMRDPGNVGLVLRHAAAFDCAGIFLLRGCCDPYNPKAVRASMGGIVTVPVEMECDAADVLGALTAHGVRVHVADNAVGASNALEVAASKAAFVIGGETEGPSSFWKEHGVDTVIIRQSANVESLNAAVAASILLCARYQIMRSKK